MKSKLSTLGIAVAVLVLCGITTTTAVSAGTPINFNLDRLSARIFSNTGTVVVNFTTSSDQDVDHFRVLYGYYSPDANYTPFSENLVSQKQTLSHYYASDFVTLGPRDILYVRVEVTFEDGTTVLSDPVVALRSRPIGDGGKLK